MTQPVPSGSPQPDSSPNGERPPMTRREARERAERAAAEQTGPTPTAPIQAPQVTSADAPHAQPAAEPAEDDGFQQSFWSSLEVQDEQKGETAGRTGAGAGEPVSTDTRPHVWSSLEYPTDGKQGKRGGRSGSDSGGAPPRKKKRRWLVVTIVVVVILGLFAGAGAYVWNAFQPEVRKLLALNEPNDYTGSGTTPVTITIKDGQNGGDVANTLQKAGVVKTYDAFYSLLLQTKPDPVFQPGAYRVKKEMSAKAALTALQDPKNKLERTLTIPEGDTEATILPALSKTTGIPLAELQAAAKPADFGLPAQAKNLDGFLFPATYTFDPGVDAKTVVKTLVDRAFQALDEDGVPADKRWNTVTLASVVQKEAGSVADMGKVARVFQNRLDQGMPLQSDATVAYGAGVKTVFTTDAERADANNLYNTYAHDGLPVGPISNPGDDAIKAAMNPTPGPWLYFVTVDLKNGTTVFSQTEAQHEAAVQQLQDWCNASAANDAYCK